MQALISVFTTSLRPNTRELVIVIVSMNLPESNGTFNTLRIFLQQNLFDLGVAL